MLRVAIAEDDFRIAQVQERFLLEVDGVEVVGKALNAKETLEMLKEKKVDLLLLDICMPDDGNRFTAENRERSFHTLTLSL